MNKKIIILIFIIAAAIIGRFLFFEKLTSQLTDIKKSTDTVLENIKKEILEPPPLRSTRESNQAYLTRDGVLKWTNIQRANNGLISLKENAKLNSAASLKVQDMFARQYFEHISPTGGNIATLLDGVGYGYITVGENLALGNYENDQALVQAWMDSPGHRANILNNRFSEIGIAVAKGNFEGRQTWLAVQAFALPFSACPQPDKALKVQLDSIGSEIARLKISADAILTELEDMHPKKGPEYNQKIDEYNAVVGQINNLVAQIKELANKYNQQVQVFNTCVAK